jgi:hypothetical protein
MTYENSIQCRLLATHCCVCGKSLVDATSVQLGIGPDCRSHVNQGISEEVRKTCNVLTHEAAVAAQEGNVVRVRRASDMIRSLGLEVLADKILERFKNAERLAKIKITEKDGTLVIQTPWKQTRGFSDAWRAIPGRTYRNGRNVVPVASKKEVWELLKRFFPDVYGVGPQGAFKVPKAPKVKEAA